jgi:hypothetical protein
MANAYRALDYKSDETKAQDQYQYYQYCRQQGHDLYLREAEIASAYYIGRQWSDPEVAEMRESNRPVLTLNQFFRALDSIVGEMIYATGDVRFTPTDTQGSDDVSDIWDKIYMDVMRQNRLQYNEPSVILQGLLTGRGYWDMRVNFDDNMQGQISLKPKRPQNVVLNPTIESPDPDTWPEVFETSMVSIDDIAYSYGDAVAQDISDTPQSDWLSPYDQANERLLSMRVNGSLYFSDFSGLNMGDPRVIKCRRLISRQYRELRYKEHFIDTQTGDMSVIPPEWDRNKIARVLEMTPGLSTIKRRAKVIRWRVSCDRWLLHDAESPYNHFTIVPFFPYFVDGYPMSLGNQLVDMQRFTNKLYSQILHILNSAANSGWKVKQGNLLNMTMEELETRGAQTGLVAEVKEMDGLERIEPGTMPVGHEKLAEAIQTIFKEVSGYTETMQGKDRADASAKSIDSKLARGQVNLANAYNALYHTKTMIAQRVVDYAQDYYTETRVMHIAHDMTNGTRPMVINQPTPEGKVLNDITVGKYDVTVVPAPSRETVQQTAFQQLYDMRKDLNVQIPDNVLIQYSAIPEKTLILEAIQNNTDPQAAQRQQQLQDQLQQADVAKKQAEATNSQAQAQLAQARAGKATSEAQYNPQKDRIALDRDRMNLEAQRNQRLDQEASHKNDRDAALKLTDMDLKHRREMRQQQETERNNQRTAGQHATDSALNHAREMHRQSEQSRQADQDHQLDVTEAMLSHQREERNNQQRAAEKATNKPSSTPRGS